MEADLEISIVLFDEHGREINIHDVKAGSDYFDQESLTPYYLWSCHGGIEIITDGYKIIFRNFDFYVSLNAIDFLINFLLYYNNQINKEWPNEGSPNSYIHTFITNDILKLEKVNRKTYSLSYQKGINSINSSRRFFSSELISVEKFNNAIRKSLNDYFELFDKVLEVAPKDKKTDTLQKYFKNRRHLLENVNRDLH